MSELIDRIETALANLRAAGPKDLRLYLARSRPELPDATPKMVDKMIDLMLAPDPNDAVVLLFENQVRDWDNSDEKSRWAAGTRRNSEGRRALIHTLLNSGAALASRIDRQIPF